MTHCHDAEPPQKLLAVSFAVMSLCQLIPFLFNILGQRVSEDSMDVMGLSIFTLGNIGGCPPKVCVYNGGGFAWTVVPHRGSVPGFRA